MHVLGSFLAGESVLIFLLEELGRENDSESSVASNRVMAIVTSQPNCRQMLRETLLLLSSTLALLAGAPALAASYVIKSVAGDGTAGYSGDDGPATAASLGNNPWSATVDTIGNLYIADTGNNTIRMVDGAGVIHTVAGNGIAGFSGDGGPATAASLNGPFAVAVNAAGEIYVADTNNNRVRKVDSKGRISTVAGGNTFGFSGDGGPATAATLYAPESIALDSIGNLYIADWGNARVRLVNPAGFISTVAGDGSNGYNGDGQLATAARISARCVALDAAGNLYIADEENSRIRKVDSEGMISTVAGNGAFGFTGDGGPATEASLYSPYAVAVSKFGRIFIADFINDRIRVVDSNGVINTIAGDGIVGFSGDGGAATVAELSNLTGIAVDGAENIYIPDGTHRIREIVSTAQMPQRSRQSAKPASSATD